MRCGPGYVVAAGTSGKGFSSYVTCIFKMHMHSCASPDQNGNCSRGQAHTSTELSCVHMHNRYTKLGKGNQKWAGTNQLSSSELISPPCKTSFATCLKLCTSTPHSQA